MSHLLNRVSIIPMLLLLVTSITAGADEASVKKEMYAIFDKSVKQFKTRDIKGFMSMIADDYKGKGPGGASQTRATMAAQMKQAMDSTKELNKAEMKITKISVSGSTANIESTMTLAMKVVDAAGTMGPKGQLHSVTEVENQRETWVKTKGGWKIKIGEVLPGGKMMVDGKPFPPVAPPKKK